MRHRKKRLTTRVEARNNHPKSIALIMAAALFAIVLMHSNSGHSNSDHPAGSVPKNAPDQRFIVFSSDADDITRSDANNFRDIFIQDRLSGATRLLSFGINGNAADGNSDNPSISDSGECVVFESEASNLVPADYNGTADIFIHNLGTGVTTRVSQNIEGIEGNAGSFAADVSSDCNLVAFTSAASNLLVGTTTFSTQVFVKNLLNNVIYLASADAQGLPGDLPSFQPSISEDGTLTHFQSSATNLSEPLAFTNPTTSQSSGIGKQTRLTLHGTDLNIPVTGSDTPVSVQTPSITVDTEEEEEEEEVDEAEEIKVGRGAIAWPALLVLGLFAFRRK